MSELQDILDATQCPECKRLEARCLKLYNANEKQHTRIEKLEKVLAASKKLQADMVMRADIGTYEGDHSVQAGATAWWVFCERIKDADAIAEVGDE